MDRDTLLSGTIDLEALAVGRGSGRRHGTEWWNGLKVEARRAAAATDEQRKCDPALGEGRVQQLFDQRTSDVADGDVGLLDALRVLRRDVEQQVDFVSERAAGFSGESYDCCAMSAASFDTAKNVGTVAAGGQGDQDIVCGDQRFDLARKDLFEAKIVGGSGEYRRICGEREGRKARAGGAQTDYQLSGEMNSVGSAAAVAEENNFAAVAQCRGGFFRERGDALDEFAGERIFDAGAFFQLSADLIG